MARGSVVDPLLGDDAAVVGVLDVAHLGDRVGEGGERGGGVTSGGDAVDRGGTVAVVKRERGGAGLGWAGGGSAVGGGDKWGVSVSAVTGSGPGGGGCGARASSSRSRRDRPPTAGLSNEPLFPRELRSLPAGLA